MTDDCITLPDFESFGLDSSLLNAIKDLGYVSPTSIQEQVISPMLERRDLLGQAQTGTGKTAAFALPLLNHLDIKNRKLQVLILTPTRELAIQVCDHIGKFAKYMYGVNILPVYGGASMGEQLRALKKGVHIVVGTPGRVMDHMRRGTLKLDTLSSIVLDEADEMLNMGFQEDVDWILERAPEKRHMSLFSATIPPAIRRIAKRFMDEPREITIGTKTTTASTIHQRYWMIRGLNKLDGLSRILEAEEHDGVIVFTRTKAATVDLAQKLEDRGFSVAPLNGDIPQHMREQTVDRLKAGRIDILVATDVAARGLDVDRISHVINYDAPHDVEAYIHRVGRTGRAGRNGEAIIFVSSRERGLLRTIEKSTRQRISELELPKPKQINDQRISTFKAKIADKIKNGKLDLFKKIAQEMQIESDFDPIDIAAAAACMFQGSQPLLLPEKDIPIRSDYRDSSFKRNPREGSGRRRVREGSGRGKGREISYSSSTNEIQFKDKPKSPNSEKRYAKRDSSKERNVDYKVASYRVEVGLTHGLKAGNLVGAIANEAGLDGKYIGRIDIQDEYSTVDLPDGMPSETMYELKRVRVAGQQLRITLNSGKHRRGKKAGESRKNRKRDRMSKGRTEQTAS